MIILVIIGLVALAIKWEHVRKLRKIRDHYKD